MDDDPWYDLLDEEFNPPSSSFEKSEMVTNLCPQHDVLGEHKADEVNAEEIWHPWLDMIGDSLEQVAAKQQDMHELLVCVAKEVQSLGAQVQVPNIAASTPTSTSKVTKEKERLRVPKKKNYTIYCDCEILDSDAAVLICLTTLFVLICLITLIISILM